MIKIEKLTKNFGKIKAVDSVSLNVNKGEAVALLGPNGAGKSTLIKCILGLLDFSGDIEVNNLNIKKNLKLSKSLIGYVPQEPLFYDMKTLDVLTFFGSIRRIKNERIISVLELVGLEKHSSKPTNSLSGGMRQRLSFAIALLSDSPILILDEPTSNLDANSRGDFLKLVKKFKDDGKTVIFSSHRLDEVNYLADRVLVMKSGRLVLESPPKKLGETLGLKIKLNLVIPQHSIKQAFDLLTKEGFNNINLNTNILSLDVMSNERIIAFNKLLTAKIPIDDFFVEEPTLESIMNEV